MSHPPGRPGRPAGAALVTVGDELLRGEIVNTNAAELGEFLSEVGLPVSWAITVGDAVPDIAAAVLEGVRRAAVVVVCGGLGPTQDDLTREGLALAAGVDMTHDVELDRQLRAALAARGGTDVPAMNLRMADLPRGARALTNSAGTAPGIRLAVGDRLVYALPGVPRELRALLAERVRPDLLASLPDLPAVVRRTVRTVGLWESRVAEAMAPEVTRTAAAGGPQIAFLAGRGETRVVVTAVAADVASAAALADPVEVFAREALAAAVYDGPSLAAAVLTLLRARSATLACAESLTAGMLAARLASVPGASDVLRGGIVAYSTDLKASLLGVDAGQLSRDGAVAARTAESMARGAARACGATYALALTGVAGPDPQEGHPPGTVFAAVHGPHRTRAVALNLPGDRAMVRELAVTSALALLRAELLGRD